MKMFSDCSGKCLICACSGGCLAGHGDDDYVLASKEQLLLKLKTGRYTSEPSSRTLAEPELPHVKQTLLQEYGVAWLEERKKD